MNEHNIECPKCKSIDVMTRDESTLDENGEPEMIMYSYACKSCGHTGHSEE